MNKKLLLIVALLINVIAAKSQMLPHRASCNNLDFADGKTTSWQARWCKSAFDNSGTNFISNYDKKPDKLPDVGFNSGGTAGSYGYVHQIVTDDAPDQYSGIKKVPPGHKYAIRLGDNKATVVAIKGDMDYPHHHQIVSNTFTVDAANPVITYWYAIVFAQEKGDVHSDSLQPYFKVKIMDEAGKPIECGLYEINATKGIADGFKLKDIAKDNENKMQECVYKDWVSISMPLINYIGKKITIQFETSDCKMGGHMGYAYLAVDCGPYKLLKVQPKGECDKLEADLTAPDGMATYEWEGDGITSDKKKQTITVNKSGKFKVKMSVATSLGTSCFFTIDTTLNLTSANSPIANFESNKACLGSPTQFKDLSKAANNPLISWSWDFDGDGKEDSKEQNPSFTFPKADSMNVTLTVSDGKCINKITKKVVVGKAKLEVKNPKPSCVGAIDITPDSLTKGSDPGTLTYWLDSACTQPVPDPKNINKAGVYYIKLTTKENCIVIKPINLSSLNAPLLVLKNVHILCGTPADISADSVNKGSEAGQLSYWLDSACTQPVTNPKNVNPGKYYVKLITSPTCFTVKSLQVLMTDGPTCNAGTGKTFCNKEPITLNGTIGGTAKSATWTGGKGTFVPDNKTLNATYTPTDAEYASGLLTLTLTTNKPAGPCDSAVSTVTYIFKNAVKLNFTVDKREGCVPHCVKFSDSTITTNDTIIEWKWLFGDNSEMVLMKNADHCYTQVGAFDVTLSIKTKTGCTAKLVKPQYITVHPKPKADFTFSPNNIISVTDPTVQLLNTSSKDVVKWDYSFGDGQKTGFLNPSPTHTYPAVHGKYNAMLIVTNKGGCVDSVTHELIITPEFSFFIPNAFTPNGDNVEQNNEYFFAKGVGIKEFQLMIFDRWGNKLFHGMDINEKWDGTVKGRVCQQDVYVWRVVLKDMLGKKHEYTGTVTLVR